MEKRLLGRDGAAWRQIHFRQRSLLVKDQTLSDKLVFFSEGEGKREKWALVGDVFPLPVNGKDQRFSAFDCVVCVVNFSLV